MDSNIGTIFIGGRRIGSGCPCFFIAEAGVNHNGDLKRAIELIDVAAEAGADAVKFQTFRAQNLVLRSAAKVGYQARNTDADEGQFEMLRKLELSADDHACLIDHCDQRGVMFLSSPFDDDSVELLESLDLPAIKVPSGELVNTSYLVKLGKMGRPLIVSTGMATLVEVGEAVAALRAAGSTQFVLLHCTTDYPTSPEDANLRAMRLLQDTYACPVGYSDHTLGPDVTIAAVAMGACVIEKHFTLDRNLPGPDHGASLEPDELASLVNSIRRVEAALGSGRKEPTASEVLNAVSIRKSIVAARRLEQGTSLTKDMVSYKRPGDGLKPSSLPLILGKRLLRTVKVDEKLTPELFE